MPWLKEPPLPPVPVTVTVPPLEVIFDGLLALPTSMTPAELLPLGLGPPVPVTATLPIPPALICAPPSRKTPSFMLPDPVPPASPVTWTAPPPEVISDPTSLMYTPK